MPAACPTLSYYQQLGQGTHRGSAEALVGTVTGGEEDFPFFPPSFWAENCTYFFKNVAARVGDFKKFERTLEKLLSR